MRGILFAMLIAAGIGLVGSADVSAAPINGAALGNAADAASPVETVQHWRWGSGGGRWGGYGGGGRRRRGWLWRRRPLGVGRRWRPLALGQPRLSRRWPLALGQPRPLVSGLR